MEENAAGGEADEGFPDDEEELFSEAEDELTELRPSHRAGTGRTGRRVQNRNALVWQLQGERWATAGERDAALALYTAVYTGRLKWRRQTHYLTYPNGKDNPAVKITPFKCRYARPKKEEGCQARLRTHDDPANEQYWFEVPEDQIHCDHKAVKSRGAIPMWVKQKAASPSQDGKQAKGFQRYMRSIYLPRAPE